MINVSNKLRIYHIAQVPCKPFYVEVENEKEASKIMDVLTNQHLFLYEENIIPDYSNVMGVEMFDEYENDWLDYYNDEEEMEWDEFEKTYLKNKLK